jgi:hypothetical protein
MSLLPAFIRARRRDSAPQPDVAADSPEHELPDNDSHGTDSHATDSHGTDSEDNIFNLLPPDAAEPAAPEPQPQGRNRHPVDMTDLSRLSIDRDGRLYWDGKPVEVRRRIAMSRAQIVGASIVAAFVMVGAIGAAIQGAATARDWACRLGWSASACSLPSGSPRSRSDIPA